MQYRATEYFMDYLSVNTFVKYSASQWAISTGAALLPCWITGTHYFDVNKT